jgi:hypothetical protein
MDRGPLLSRAEHLRQVAKVVADDATARWLLNLAIEYERQAIESWRSARQGDRNGSCHDERRKARGSLARCPC